jgi:acetylornithine deacetylase/succinyl-diaminopimelate desuccinylase-like protein
LNVENLQCYTGLDLKDIDFHPAWSVPDDSDIVRKCQSALGEMAMEAKPITIHYCSNGSQSAGIDGIPTVILGPPSIEQAHAVDGFIEIENLQHAVTSFRRIASSLLRD